MRKILKKEGAWIAVSVIATVFMVDVIAAQAPDSGSGVASVTELNRRLSNLSLGKIFIYLFVMLGPDKLLVPFANLTKRMDDASARSLAVKGFSIACAAGLVAAVVGQNIITSWRISLPALLVAAGLVLLLVALQRVMAQYQQRTNPVEPEVAASEPSTLVAMSQLAFPNIITPYGTAVLILLLAAAAPGQSLAIFAAFVAVMIINLIAMFYTRAILRYGSGILAVVGSVLGVLQVALAVQMLLVAGQMIGMIPPSAESAK